jgi:hypothetical protein
VLEFLIGCGGWDEETVTISCGESTNYSCTSNGGVDDGNNVGELGFED